ncbi:transposase [Candidatus Venteria ishoeyi]|uniref:transposase n=1 Tax=Candidatus Venteria ishoeyi TaxID=1899563 RepID=UPI0025A5547E|nr:transposase [Candidatus Venteria ishoeyi]MDM8546292.1 transposase [Candidatus Venteria ishoeyi]
MPRIARTVFAELPHHIIQRGNRRGNVFFTDEDRDVYLEWLQEYCQKHEVEILAYCLMTNHVHLVAAPKTESGLQRVFKPIHMRYAQYINRQYGWSGHLWQGRFFSSPLDEAYLWFCVRYVERNPVRAGMVERAEDYLWSSAAAHCGLRDDALLTTDSIHCKVFEDISDYSAWLGEDDNDTQLNIMRRNIQKNLPCGSNPFIEQLERISGRILSFRPIGRPKKAIKG